MKTNLSFQILLQQYVFTIANTFIEQVAPEEQQQLLKLISDLGKVASQPLQSDWPTLYQHQRT